jgi:hypothetical protein
MWGICQLFSSAPFEGKVCGIFLLPGGEKKRAATLEINSPAARMTGRPAA